MIDWARIDEIRLEMGADFDEVVTLFLEEVGEVIDRLSSGPAGDGLAADLHFLKGAALNLGFGELARQCVRNEQLVRAGQGSAVDLAALTACFHASGAALAAAIARGQG